MKTLTSICLVMLSIFSTQAFSLGGGLDLKDGLFWSADLNRNEQLDIQEAKAIYNLGNENVFTKYDTSGEGVITKFEFYDYLNQRGAEE